MRVLEPIGAVGRGLWRVGGVLGVFDAYWAVFGGVLGASWVRLGASWGRLRGLLNGLWRRPGRGSDFQCSDVCI